MLQLPVITPNETPLQLALSRSLKVLRNTAIVEAFAAELREQLVPLEDYELQKPADAKALANAMQELLGRADALALARGTASPLSLLAGLFQDVSTPEAYEVLATDGFPSVFQLYDALLANAAEEQDNLLLLLKLFALFDVRPGHERLIAAAKSGLAADDFVWPIILRQVDTDHPARHWFCSQLRDPLPTGMIGAAYLALCNRLALAGELMEHPFNTPAGYERLEFWLNDPQEGPAGTAQIVATALPFVSGPTQLQLLTQALRHPLLPVRLEASWAAARLGHPVGFQGLVAYCREPWISRSAQEYLTELQRADLIPAECQDPAFQACCALCQWLAHPLEYGRPPVDVALADVRTIHWPPTRDERDLWLFKFAYPADSDTPGELRWQLGLVGSITFSLGLPVDMPAEDALALHCCWELQVQHDPRAPAERSVAAGRQLLGWK